MKNLLIGWATGYEFAQIAIWLHSFREFNSRSEWDLMLYVSDPRIAFGCNPPLTTTDIVRSVASTQYSPTTARWFAIANDLSTMVGKYEHILITDTRDVAFGGAIDTSAIPRRPLPVVGEEFGAIEDCPINRRWISDCYGESEAALIGKNTILCAGVVLGTTKQILRFCNLMCAELVIAFERVATDYVADQACLNHLASWVSIPSTPWSGRHICTVGRAIKQGSIHADDHLLLAQNRIILHQYNRSETLTEMMQQKWLKA